jgi:predicted cupin superfamily sugar epimerase
VHSDARELIEALGLAPHPEGGFFKETFRSGLALTGMPWLPPNVERNASTAIYFLLPAGVFSAFHRVMADEVWHHYAGDPVVLHTLAPPPDPNARSVHEMVRLGADVRQGQRPQHVVRGGVWQAATVEGDRYALCGCTVAPGFDFADFVMPAEGELVSMFPDQAALISSLTRR